MQLLLSKKFLRHRHNHLIALTLLGGVLLPALLGNIARAAQQLLQRTG